jgi:cyanophycinase-like exopeptidase
MRIITLFLLSFTCLTVSAQSYTYYQTGDTTDVSPVTQPGTCLMGGATEHDNAMVWFLDRSGGGNILVIRASGSDGYNDYLYSELGVTVQSVETIVFNNTSAAQDPFVLERIAKAEAIWMAGGNQWDYVSYWRDSPVGDLLNAHALQKQAPIGGTSAGMAIAGGVYFSAQNGTITSNTALNNPYHPNVTLGYEDFLDLPYLNGVVTDTHYDDPDRRGRHVAFLARMATDQGLISRGIACDEYTAVCIDENGNARCFGEYPAYDEDIYFLQANCEVATTPETCAAGSPLTWNHGGAAVKVYRVKGTLSGDNSFELSDWLTGDGGEWENWWAQDGQFMSAPSVGPDCVTGIDEIEVPQQFQYDSNMRQLSYAHDYRGRVLIYDALGRVIWDASYTVPITLAESIHGLILVQSTHEGRFVVGKVLVD